MTSKSKSRSEKHSKARHPSPLIVTPAQAGVQWRPPPLGPLDTSLRWYDEQEQKQKRKAQQGAAPIPLTVTPAQAGVQWRPPTTDATG
jgi:hypothetical protein